MSLKSELLIYQSALEAYDGRQLSLALSHFGKIAETSKVQWNMGIILASMGRHDEAVARYSESVAMDQYLVVGWFQRGISYFKVGMYDKAVKDFQTALGYMRGNQTINYTQLGLAHTIHSCEVTFNLGLTKLYLGQTAAGMQDLRQAQADKVLPDHGVIDDCIRDQGRRASLFTVPDGLLFRPPASKLKNLQARDYMGKAVLVAASDPKDAYTTFTGITRLQRGQTPTGAPLDPAHPLGRSASVSAIPTPDKDVTPIANRMAKRSQTVRVAPLPSPGLSRSLTVSNPDPPSPSPARHARSRTAESVSVSSIYTQPLRPPPLVRPTRPRIVIPAPQYQETEEVLAQSARYPAFPIERNRLYPPTSYRSATPGEVLQTPEDRDRHTPLDEIYDEYRSPTPELIPDEPEMPYTGIGQYFASPSPLSAKSVSPVPRAAPSAYKPPTSEMRRRASNRTLARSASRVRSPAALAASAPTNGLMLTVEDGNLSPLSDGLDLVKIRIKVHVGKHTRGMSVYPDESYADLVQMLRTKFPELGQKVNVRFKDEDGDMMSMQDDGDFEAAIDVARVMSQGRAEGKLEIWVE